MPEFNCTIPAGDLPVTITIRIETTAQPTPVDTPSEVPAEPTPAPLPEPTRPQADVYLTIGDAPYTTSQFHTGMQHVDYVLRGGAGVQSVTAQKAAKALVSGVMQTNVSHIHGFGVACTWPDTSKPAPSNFGTLDAQIALFDELGGNKAMVFYGFPFWMREVVGADGSARAMIQSEQYSDDGRVRLDMLAQFDAYTLAVAKRYIAKGVLKWVFGNELKGYYMRRDRKRGWDYEEYTNLYNRWADVMVRAATDLGIDRATLKLGGPYAPVRTEAQPSNNTVGKDHMLYGRPYGEFRANALDAIAYWLSNADRADFVAFDMGSGNVAGGEKVDTFVVQANKYADFMRWLRTLTDLPAIITELYPRTADDGNADIARVAAAKMVAHLSIVESGYAGAWLWGPLGAGEGDSNAGNGGLFSDTLTADDPVVRPWYDAYRALRQHFTAGKALYPVTVEGERADAIYARATDQVLAVVNLTPQPRSVAVGSDVWGLTPHQVLVVERG